MDTDKIWGVQWDLGARYQPSHPLEKFLSEALVIYVKKGRSAWIAENEDDGFGL